MTAPGTADIRWLDNDCPGLVGEIVRWHGLYYVRGLNWAPVFEALCAEQLGETARHFGTRDDVAVFSAWEGQTFLAAVVMDARPGQRPGARLRFFITSDQARGRGIGSRLMTRALEWSRRLGHPSVWLTTVAGLDASAHVYRKFGFEIVDEHIDRSWGDEHTEQVWERPAGV